MNALKLFLFGILLFTSSINGQEAKKLPRLIVTTDINIDLCDPNDR